MSISVESCRPYSEYIDGFIPHRCCRKRYLSSLSEMACVLTIAWGIVLGFLILAIIMWILGLLIWWLFGSCVMNQVNDVFGTVEISDTNGNLVGRYIG